MWNAIHVYLGDTLAGPSTWPSITSRATSRCSAPMDQCACSYTFVYLHTQPSVRVCMYVCTKLCRYACSCVSVYTHSCVGVWYQRMCTWTTSTQVVYDLKLCIGCPVHYNEPYCTGQSMFIEDPYRTNTWGLMYIRFSITMLPLL